MWVCDMAAMGLRYQEFYTLLQEQPTLSRLAFVVITKADEVALRVKLLTLGALDFLTAPFRPERCAIRLQTHLAALQNSSQQSDQMHQKIRTVIHDLRNPLGILVGYTEYLLEALDELSPTEQKYVLEKMRLGQQKMDDLIDMLMADV
jgi:signal transduction histidine kinase